MTSAFSFGFSGDDIDIDDAEINDIEEENASHRQTTGSTLPDLVEAKRHGMGEWLSGLPSQISYNTFEISSSQDANNPERRPFTIARRDVFDIRAQLMAEDSVDEENGELIAGLEKGDIKPNFYEGGFKTWECSLDLAKLVSEEKGVISDNDSSVDRHIIELGAGTAVPSLALFAQLLSQSETGATASGFPRRTTHFTFADYNSAVLRLVTLPNLLLTWNYFVTRRDTAASSDGQPEEKAGDKEEEDLDITPELVERFQKDLAERGILVTFISGAWSPAFVDLVFSSAKKSKSKSVILASETIYSPASLTAFSETLLALLRRPRAGEVQSKAFIAAKKVYFGVGGGVDEFLAVLGAVSGNDLEVKERVDIKSEGVGRVILEIDVRQ